MTEPTTFESLFEGPARHHSSPRDTELEAARKASKKAPSMRRRIYDLVVAAGHPMSPEEVHAVLTASGVSVLLGSTRSRMSDLGQDGLLVDSGERAPSVGGNKAIRWRAVSGREFFERKAAKTKPLDASPEASEAYAKARALLASGRPAVHLLAELILQNEGVAHV